jgi:transcriptional regulator with XRE-family HTH domain
MLQEHYPNRLCYLRRRHGFSQKQMATLIGLRDRTMISKYEHGYVLPSFPMASKFEIALNANGPDIFPRQFNLWRREVDYVKETQLKNNS